jgi:hypothetical protein
VIFKHRRPAATRARSRVRVGRELFARYLRKLACFSGHSSPRPPKGENRIHEVGYLIDSDAGSDLDFNRAKNLFSFSLRRAWARALKNPVNRLSLRVKTRARAHARLGREFDAGLQKT